MPKEKKEKKESLVVIGISEDKRLLVNGDEKKLKDFNHFNTEEDVKVSSFDLDGIKKEVRMVKFADINFEGSERFQQRITDGALRELIVSINERGLLTPISVTLSNEEEDAYDCLDGFTRGRAINALINGDLEAIGLEDLEIQKEFEMESEIPVIVYTNDDGTRISDEDCYRIASMGNTIRKSWNIIDIANSFKTTLRRLIESQIADKLANPQIREHVDVLFKQGTPLIILNGLLHANILKKAEIALLKEKVFKELEKDTQLSRAQLRIYSRIAEIPERFYPVITGQKNQWGIVLSPKNALELFLTKGGQCKKDTSIESILNQLKRKANPSGKGSKKVTGAQAGELADALSEEGSTRSRKINSTERNVGLMLIEHYANKKGTVGIKELPVLMDAYQNSTSLEDFTNTFKEKTGITLPPVTQFMVDRAGEETEEAGE